MKIGDTVLIRYGRIVELADAGTITGADIKGEIVEVQPEGVTVRLDRMHHIFIRPQVQR